MMQLISTIPDGYYALAVSIVKGVPVDAAIELLDSGHKTRKCKKNITSQDIEDMLKLKKTMSYREIGELYGMSHHAVYRRIKRYVDANDN